MQEKTRYIEQGNAVQQRRHSEVDNEEDIQGGLRIDMFEHDHPDDLQCLCDLPYATQEIIYNESDL